MEPACREAGRAFRGAESVRPVVGRAFRAAAFRALAPVVGQRGRGEVAEPLGRVFLAGGLIPVEAAPPLAPAAVGPVEGPARVLAQGQQLAGGLVLLRELGWGLVAGQPELLRA